jgi:hypothetical protein
MFKESPSQGTNSEFEYLGEFEAEFKKKFGYELFWTGEAGVLKSSQ